MSKTQAPTQTIQQVIDEPTPPSSDDSEKVVVKKLFDCYLHMKANQKEELGQVLHQFSMLVGKLNKKMALIDSKLESMDKRLTALEKPKQCKACQGAGTSGCLGKPCSFCGGAKAY